MDRDDEDEGRLAVRKGLHVPLQRLVPYPALQHLDEEPLLHVGVTGVGARLDVLGRLRDEAREPRADGDPVPTDVVRTDMLQSGTTNGEKSGIAICQCRRSGRRVSHRDVLQERGHHVLHFEEEQIDLLVVVTPLNFQLYHHPKGADGDWAFMKVSAMSFVSVVSVDTHLRCRDEPSKSHPESWPGQVNSPRAN